MTRFIDEYRDVYGVEPICKTLPRVCPLGIAPLTYYARVAERNDPSKLSARAKRDAVLKLAIKRVFEDNHEVYGVRKVWHQMRRDGHTVARCTVARLMRELGIGGIIRGKSQKTTFSNIADVCARDLVNRQFKAPAPNVLWVSDFTYVSTWAGFVCVAFVIDTYARRIVG